MPLKKIPLSDVSQMGVMSFDLGASPLYGTSFVLPVCVAEETVDLLLVCVLPSFQRVQFELWDSDDVPVPRKELLQKVKDVDGLLCVLTEKIDAELLDAAGMTSGVFDFVEEQPQNSLC